ncbi:MAG: AraC family ligand binding domain-containing protein [Clostridiales bacterium]|nr:AraC family ligand binding domain-containing protein [Clostridiales bacterium]
MILEGQVSLFSQEKTTTLQKGDFFVVNPLCSHELSAVDPVMVLSLQVAPAFSDSIIPNWSEQRSHERYFPAPKPMRSKKRCAPPSWIWPMAISCGRRGTNCGALPW